MRRLWRMSAVKASIVLLALGSGQATRKIDSEEVEVEVSSRWMIRAMSDPRGLLVHGTNFKRDITKLHFHPPLPESMFYQQVRSPTEIAIVKIGGAANPVSWRAKPGPLKVVAIELGDEWVQAVNPEGGGVIVAEIVADNLKDGDTPPSAPPASDKPPPPSLIEPEDSEVRVLSTFTIDDFIRAEFAVVEFYDPSNHHCRRLFPEYTAAAFELKRLDPAIKLGKIDVTDDTNRSLLDRFDAFYPPTFKMFRKGVEVLGSPLAHFRNTVMFVEYLITEKATEDGVSALAPTLLLPRLPSFLEPEESAVSVLSKDTFDDFIEADFAVVDFYMPWSGLCKRLFPQYTQASIELRLLDPDIKLGKVNMDDGINRPLSERFVLSGFPNIKIFRNGVLVSDYSGRCNTRGLVDDLMAEKAKQDGVAPPPPLVEPEDSEVSVLSKVTIDNFIRADFAVVQFYFPDPDSRLLSPEYTKAAIELKRVDPDIKVGKIDMLDDTNRPLIERFGVRSFHTVKIFRKGVEVLGSHDALYRDAAEIVEYLVAEKAKEEDGVSALAPDKPVSRQPRPLMEPEESAVRVLSKDTFDDFIQADFAVVKFFMRWDVNSVKLFPEYTKASIELRLLDPEIKLGKINMDNRINRPLSGRFDVRAFPAIKIFRNGVLLSDYSGRHEARVLARSLLHAKMEQDQIAPPPPPRPPLAEPNDSEVSVLSKDTIDDFIQADFTVVEFYVPWSSRCQSLFEEYTKASIELKRVDPDIRMGKIDLTDGFRPLSGRFDVSEFPTFKIFHNGVEVLGPHLTRVRDAAEIVEYVFTAKGKKDGVLGRHPPLMEPEDSEVTVLSKDTIDDFIGADFAVVEFYAPLSPFCVRFSPEYTKASIELKRVDPDIKLGKIDIADSTNRTVKERFGVQTYPVTKVFRNGGEVSSLDGGRSAAKLVEYLMTVKEEEEESQLAASSPAFEKSPLEWLRAAREGLPAFGMEWGEVWKILMETLSEDPDTVSINASDVEIFPGRTQELLITGHGFSAADPPELRFEHALDRGVKTDVVNRTTIRVEIQADASGWTPWEEHVGPLKIKGIVTGAAGMKVVDPPVTVATVMPNFGASEGGAQPY